MTIEKRIKSVAEASGLSEEKVKELIEKKKEDAAGLLTDHGALYALEKEYGVSAAGEDHAEYTPISEVKINSNNVNIVGVIKEIRPIKTFSTEKRSGQFARMVLGDGDDINVVMWDKAAEIVNSDKISLGTLIAIRNGYTREGLDKNPEIHLGGLSRIIIDPKNIDKAVIDKMPKVEDESKKIGELKEGEVSSTIGRILYLYPKSEFQRSDGRTGQRASAIIEDETGKIRVVLWDANANSIENFGESDVVKVENGQVRSGTRGLEIHIGNRGRMIASDAEIKLPEMKAAKTYKVAEIEPGLQNVNVAGRVMRILPVKEFTSGDRTGKLASLILVDGTGISRAVLWGDKTEHVKDINQGDIVLIKNGYTKNNLNGEAEVHVGNRGNIHVNPEDVKIDEVAMLMDKHSEEKKISGIKPDDRNVKISGTVEDIGENRIVFEICAECGSRIENVAGEWLCDVCGESNPAYGMVISCGISDGSGDIRAIFYRDLPEQLSGLSVADVLNTIGQSGDENAPIQQIRDDIVGKKVTITGNIRYNDYQDKLEIIASSLSVSDSKTPKRSATKKKDIPEEIPEEVLKDDEDIPEEEIEIEEIKLDE
jgi:replication factor A1